MTRTVAQLVTSAWPPSASTQPQLLALVREAASLGRGARGPGPVMVWSPPQVTRCGSVYQSFKQRSIRRFVITEKDIAPTVSRREIRTPMKLS